MEILFLILIGGFVWFWQDSLRVREAAIAAAREFCAREEVQFLDGEAVAMVQLRLQRNTRGRLTIARRYRFEFTDTGDNRLSGHVLMLGHEVDVMHLPRYGLSAIYTSSSEH